MQSQKHLFSLDPGTHYLNCAYKSPLLKKGEQAATQALIKNRNPAGFKSTDFFDEVNETRELYAQLINAPTDSIAIIPSSSYGFASVMHNLNPKKSGRAITIKEEFPSGRFAIEEWAAKNEQELLVIEASTEEASKKGASWNRNLLKAIDSNTSVVLISSIHWMNGVIYDLEAIGNRCEEVDAYLIIDGSQSVGAMPMDVERFKIDALIVVGYKWLFGGYSMGMAYMGPKFNEGRPIEASWMNRLNSEDFTQLMNYENRYKPKAARYSVGQFTNFLTMPILKEGIKQLLEWKVENIQTYCTELIKPLMAFQKEQGFETPDPLYFSSHLFSLELPSTTDNTVLKQVLADAKITVSQRGMDLRVSCNVFNDSEDIEALLQVLRDMQNS